MPNFEAVCVWCGSSDAVRKEFIESARQFGGILADRGISLVYGGGGTGLMGAVASGALAGGGRVIGVLPRFFDVPELKHDELTELHIVDTMHERQAKMIDLAQGFVAMPGGMGTMGEFFEGLTWAQIGLHRKPIGLLNVNRYYDGLLDFVEHAGREHFLFQEHSDLILCEQDPEALIDRMQAYQSPVLPGKWIRRKDLS
jgi:uncharacterized protein (TIGR00730 family)